MELTKEARLKRAFENLQYLESVTDDPEVLNRIAELRNLIKDVK